MNREIKFRGLRTDGKGWVYGYFTHTNKNFPPCIHVTVIECYEIIPETVGQYTGLKDKNGKEIYEGDILRDIIGIGVVRYYAPQFIVHTKDEICSLAKGMVNVEQLKETEIIGNIHENPELLK